ncbi:MAG: putative ABC transport system permease protein [Planctomycetota bacterium]
MKVRSLIQFVARETRGAVWRSSFFAVCIGIGVAAVVAVAALADGIEDGLRSNSRELLAADLSIQARRPLPDELDSAIAAVLPQSQRIDVREMGSMVGVPSQGGEILRSSLCELKIVGSGYPFFGDLELVPPRSLDDLLSASSVVVSPAALSGFGVDLGDELVVGGATFTIAGVAHNEPDRLDFALTLGPRVFLSDEGFAETALTAVGNRVKYKALLRTQTDSSELELASLRRQISGQLSDASYLRIESHFEAQPGVRRGLQRFRSYLGLVALLSLLLGGIGVAQIVRTWLRSRILSIAVWKSLGLQNSEIIALHCAHVLLLAIVGSALGAVCGSLIPLALTKLAPEYLSADSLRAFPPGAVLRGIGLGVGIALLFALPSLSVLISIPPAAVLRQIELPPASLRWRIFSAAVMVVGIFSSSWVQSADAEVAGAFTLGLAVFATALWLAARGLVHLAGRLPRHALKPSLAHALAALARPGSGTVGSIVALGLGAMVVTAMALIESRLGDALRGALPENAPSVFLVDVQTDQWPGVEQHLKNAQAQGTKALPVSMARLSAIDDVPVRDLLSTGQRRDGRWGLTREQRLTWWDELPESNRLVQGSLWQQPDVAEASLEVDFAEGIGAKLGTRLRFDLQGVPIEVVVTSLRTVEWESFEINFFIAVEPGLLDEAPQVRLAAARVPVEAEAQLQDALVAEFPNVTMLRVRPILEKVAGLLERIALGVQVLGAFTILAGILILAGAVVATRLGRSREVALMKTMGLTRMRIIGLFSSEFALTGSVAGVLGSLGAAALAWGFLDKVVKLEADLPGRVFVVAVLGTILMAVVAGLAASRQAIGAPPVHTLRSRD